MFAKFFGSVGNCLKGGNAVSKSSDKDQAKAWEKAEVVLVGCGCPLRGMGWYHAVQLLGGDCASANLKVCSQIKFEKNEFRKLQC